jgi:hypothetical protein
MTIKQQLTNIVWAACLATAAFSCRKPESATERLEQRLKLYTDNSDWGNTPIADRDNVETGYINPRDLEVQILLQKQTGKYRIVLKYNTNFYSFKCDSNNNVFLEKGLER